LQHEDIDQVFSIISRWFRRLPNEEAKTPQSSLAEMTAALESRFIAKTAPLLATPDWITYLRTHLRPGITGIQHCTLETDDAEEVQRMPSHTESNPFKPRPSSTPPSEPVSIPSLPHRCSANLLDPQAH
jgi:hypothetical protein